MTDTSLLRLCRILVLLTLVGEILGSLPTNVWRAADRDRLLEHARKISVVRVPDTPAHHEVRKYITDAFKQIGDGWTIEEDAFTDKTPLGEKNFVNLIATLDAIPGVSSDRYLVLAAHYDSKMFPFHFEAACDSAVPCALLIEFATIFKSVTADDILMKKDGTKWGIKLVFFDGEEAFVQWTEKDSLYGSRHLVQDWSLLDPNGKSFLSKIDTFFLLDLIGASSSAVIPSRIAATNEKFNYLYRAQETLKSAKKLPTNVKHFSDSPTPWWPVEDDHMPFLSKGVSVVHIIPTPFPSVWHQTTDTFENIDQTATRQISSIFNLAVVNYLMDH